MSPYLNRALGALLLLSACDSEAGQPGNHAAGVETPANATITPTATASTEIAHPARDTAAARSRATEADEAFARQLATLLVGRATLDGRPLTGVRAIDKCHTAFGTTDGDTVIDWTKAGNLAAHDADGREISRLPTADGLHDLSVPQGDLPQPAGNVANRSSGAFGQLALECGN